MMPPMHEPQRERRETGRNPTRDMGNMMVVLAWVVLLGLLTMLFSNHDERRRNPNREVESRLVNGQAEVRLRQNPQGHYVAVGRINDQPVTFMLDTGATLISVPARLARDLGLRPGARVNVETANGRINVALTRLRRVSLGDIELRNVKATINPYSGDDTILLGMSFLKDLELTQRDDELLIRQRQAR